MSAGPDAQDLACFQEALRDLLPDSAQIRRSIATPTSIGGTKKMPSIVATVPCSIEPLGNSPEERSIAERVQAEVLWTISLPAGTVVQADDDLLVGTHTYHVVAPLSGGSWELTRRVACIELL